MPIYRDYSAIASLRQNGASQESPQAHIPRGKASAAAAIMPEAPALPKLSLKERVQQVKELGDASIAQINAGIENLKKVGKKCASYILAQQIPDAEPIKDIQTIQDMLAARESLQEALTKFQKIRSLILPQMKSVQSNAELKKVHNLGIELNLSDDGKQLIPKMVKAEKEALASLVSIDALIGKITAQSPDLVAEAQEAAKAAKAQEAAKFAQEHDSATTQYNAALGEYRNNPSDDNAEALENSIVALLKMDEIATDRGMSPKIDMKPLACIYAKHYRLYDAALKQYRKNLSYSNAEALAESVDALLGTAAIRNSLKIAEKYRPNTDIKYFKATLQEAEQRMKEIKQKVEEKNSQYLEDLQEYQQIPSCENAAVLQESIANLLEAIQVAKQQDDFDPGIDSEAVKLNLVAAKQTLVAQYEQDCIGFDGDKSYRNAMALYLSATALFRSEEIGKQYGILQMDDLAVEVLLQAAKAQMQTIKDEIRKTLSDLDVPSNVESGVLRILEDRVTRLDRQIEEIIDVHVRDVDSGHPLSEERWNEIREWKAVCLPSCQKLSKKLEAAANKGLFSSIISKLRRLMERLHSLVIAARGPISPELDGLALLICRCAKDLGTLQPQSKALESASTLPLPEAVALFVQAGCGPVAQEVIDRRNALQTALLEFSANKKQRRKEPGYADLERAVKSSTKMLDELNAAIKEFEAFDVELQEICKMFDVAHNQYRKMLDGCNPNHEIIYAEYLRNSVNREKYIFENIEMPGVFYAANKLRGHRGFYRFRAKEVFDQDKAYVEGMRLKVESFSHKVQENGYHRALGLYEEAIVQYRENQKLKNALALQRSAERVLELHNREGIKQHKSVNPELVQKYIVEAGAFIEMHNSL